MLHTPPVLSSFVHNLGLGDAAPAHEVEVNALPLARFRILPFGIISTFAPCPCQPAGDGCYSKRDERHREQDVEPIRPPAQSRADAAGVRHLEMQMPPRSSESLVHVWQRGSGRAQTQRAQTECKCDSGQSSPVPLQMSQWRAKSHCRLSSGASSQVRI